MLSINQESKEVVFPTQIISDNLIYPFRNTFVRNSCQINVDIITRLVTISIVSYLLGNFIFEIDK